MSSITPIPASPIKVIIIDDMAPVREHVVSILCPPACPMKAMQALERQTMASIKGHPVSHEHDQAQNDPQFIVHEAAQGLEGVERILEAKQQNTPYDYAIVDMMIPPGIDGMETIRRIRRFDQDIRIIVSAAFGIPPESELKSANGGYAPVVLPKPIEPDELMKVITNA